MPRTPVTTGFLDITYQVSVDGVLADLGKQIKELDKRQATAVRKRLRDGIKRAGADLVTAVQAEASWSSRIPAATRLKVSFGARSAGVTVSVDAKKAPHARPLEMGNKNVPDMPNMARRPRLARDRALRHPIFPDPSKTRDEWVWIDQPTRPFFFKAETAISPLMYARMKKVLDEVADDLGFTGN